MKREQQLNRNATIYHYQLIHKINIPQEVMASYMSISLIFGLFQFLMYQWSGLLSWMLGILIIQVVHYLIIRLTMIRVDEPDDRRWSWRSTIPWIGYVPVQMVDHGLFRKLHRHLLWFGLCMIAVIYPWAPEPYMVSLICWHLWTLMPRLVILHKLRKNRRDGVLKLQSNEVCFYHR
ncbi:transposase [Paenibacillus sambharensis]|uniref:Transposase n=1 Tax=Paenibacillus sambharensis TaxID=1803190 RepID=A0A2W1LSR6_9BACL|nr:transposase [Paenibacillus sambharensis]PZD94891.1 transposase [Paenibacillus sambharensis]